MRYFREPKPELKEVRGMPAAVIENPRPEGSFTPFRNRAHPPKGSTEGVLVPGISIWATVKGQILQVDVEGVPDPADSKGGRLKFTPKHPGEALETMDPISAPSGAFTKDPEENMYLRAGDALDDPSSSLTWTEGMSREPVDEIDLELDEVGEDDLGEAAFDSVEDVHLLALDRIDEELARHGKTIGGIILDPEVIEWLQHVDAAELTGGSTLGLRYKNEPTDEFEYDPVSLTVRAETQTNVEGESEVYLRIYDFSQDPHAPELPSRGLLRHLAKLREKGHRRHDA